MRSLKKLIPLLLVVMSFAFAGYVSAVVDLNTPLNSAGEGMYGAGAAPGPDKMPEIIGKVIGVVLSITGVMLVIIIVYAGYLWMTAGGESDQVKKAKDWMLNAIIGLLICIVAYALSNFVITKIFEAVS